MGETDLKISIKTRIIMIVLIMYNFNVLLTTYKMFGLKHIILGPFLLDRIGVLLVTLFSFLVCVLTIYGIIRRTKWCISLVQIYYSISIIRAIMNYFSITIGKKRYIQNFTYIAKDLKIDDKTISSILDKQNTPVFTLFYSLVLSGIVLFIISKNKAYFIRDRLF